MKTLSLLAIAAFAAFGFTGCDDKKVEMPVKLDDAKKAGDAAKAAVDKGTQDAKAATDKGVGDAAAAAAKVGGAAASDAVKAGADAAKAKLDAGADAAKAKIEDAVKPAKPKPAEDEVINAPPDAAPAPAPAK